MTEHARQVREDRTVRCPKCGASVCVRLTATLTPDDREPLQALFNGTLNRPECPACGSYFLVDMPLTYRVNEPPYILYLVEPPEDGSTEDLENEIDAMATEVFSRDNLPRPTVRLTFTRVDFIEKIAILNLGFDDRIVEYTKLHLFRTFRQPELSRRKHKLLLDYSRCDDKVISFILFDRETLKPLNTIQIPREEFDSLAAEVNTNEHFLNELDAAFPGCNVSADNLL